MAFLLVLTADLRPGPDQLLGSLDRALVRVAAHEAVVVEHGLDLLRGGPSPAEGARENTPNTPVASHRSPFCPKST